ncbi:MAG: GAF domain-containing protein [Phycisphaerae bacterium]
MTGYVPLLDSSGTQIGVVAVDITVDEYERQLGGVRTAAALAMVPAIILSGVAGLGCFRLRQREARLVVAIRDALDRTTREQVVLAEIAASPATAAGDVPRLARELTERGAAALHVERVGVWLFDESQTMLRCVDTYEATPDRHSSGTILLEREYRNEFDALRTQRYVNADDALADPRTAGYVHTYLVPLGVTSMLDAAIRSSGATLGVMCFEHVGPRRHWAPDEIAFACRLADQVALALASDERQRARALAEESMRRQEQTLRDLERLNSAMAGREERLLELKSEVNALLAELHRVPRYRVTATGDEPEIEGVPRT